MLKAVPAISQGAAQLVTSLVVRPGKKWKKSAMHRGAMLAMASVTTAQCLSRSFCACGPNMEVHAHRGAVAFSAVSARAAAACLPALSGSAQWLLHVRGFAAADSNFDNSKPLEGPLPRPRLRGGSLTDLPNLLSLSRVVAGPAVAYLITTQQWSEAAALTAIAGVRFSIDKCHCCCCECAASRASLLTGSSRAATGAVCHCAAKTIYVQTHCAAHNWD